MKKFNLVICDFLGKQAYHSESFNKLNYYTLRIEDQDACKIFDALRLEQFSSMLKPTFIFMLCCFLIQVVNYLRETGQKDDEGLQKSSLNFIFLLSWVILNYYRKHAAPFIIFFAFLIVAIVENLHVRKLVFDGAGNLEIGIFSLLEAWIIIMALNCCRFVHSALVLPPLALVTHFFYVTEFSKFVVDPVTSDPYSESEQRSFIVQRLTLMLFLVFISILHQYLNQK